MNITFLKTSSQLVLQTLTCSILSMMGLAASGQHKLPGKLHFGIIYPLSTNGTHAPLDTNNLSIHLIAGVSASEQGASFAGLSNIIRKDTKGFHFAGFSNHIGKEANGGLFAGFLNTYQSGDAIAVSGFANLASGNIKGAQFAGFINKAKNAKGPQVAGFINLAGKSSATQVAGFINKAKDVNGTQIAGFINIAQKVKGAQLAGFINVADSSDYPIGIINIIKKGEKSIGLTTDDNLTTILSFRSGGKVMYGIIGIGYNFNNTDEVYAFQAGLGAHFFSSKKFRLNAEIVGTSLENFKSGEYFKSSMNLMPALKLTPHLEFFGGPSINYINTNTIEGISLQKHYITTWENKWGNNFQALYLGYGAGIQYNF